MELKLRRNGLVSIQNIYLIVGVIIVLTVLVTNNLVCYDRQDLGDCFTYYAQSSQSNGGMLDCFWFEGHTKFGTTFRAALHSNKDTTSNAIRFLGRWYDCDSLEKRFIEIGGSSYLDIGGFVGVCVSVMARLGFEVQTFEVNPHNIVCLRETVYGAFSLLTDTEKKRVTIQEVGLSDKESTVYMSEKENHMGGNHLESTPTSRNDLTLKTIRYDDLYSTKVFDIVKIDVEGYECKVLCGAVLNISKGNWKFLQIEIVDNSLRKNYCSKDQIFKILKELGFKSLGPLYFYTFIQSLDYQFVWNPTEVNLETVEALCMQ